MSGLQLLTREQLLKGGTRGPAIKPGDASASLLFQAVMHLGKLVMPPTGKELNVGNIAELEPNIHAGIKYMRFMEDQYFKDEPMDDLNKMLMTFAAYNAGPGRLRQLRRETEKRGLNPNLWFNNVERIASERIGRETVTYVSNIFKYYVAYRLLMDQRERREAAKAAVETRK